MHKSKAADLQGVPKNRSAFGHSVHTAWAINARRLFNECPLDGQDRPPDGLLQNGLCDFIPNPACQSFFLFIVCIGILYIQGRVGAKVLKL